ncbi:MAG TPA: nuclease-related domain-containing protein, partial [Pseudolysinimonas sp.]|nr:nuclease-related domain-containing protein [Pseudolysinimonas sp.]
VVLGRRLDAAVGVRVLHDRRIPGSKANIDHIAIGPRGVFVIDAKHYTGGPTLRTSGGLFSPRVEKLMIGSRDHTSLVAGVHKQVRLVDDALESAGLSHVPTFGMLCFVEAEWPLIGGDFTIDGVEVLWPRKAVARVTASGPLVAEDVGLPRARGSIPARLATPAPTVGLRSQRRTP